MSQLTCFLGGWHSNEGSTNQKLVGPRPFFKSLGPIRNNRSRAVRGSMTPNRSLLTSKGQLFDWEKLVIIGSLYISGKFLKIWDAIIKKKIEIIEKRKSFINPLARSSSSILEVIPFWSIFDFPLTSRVSRTILREWSRILKTSQFPILITLNYFFSSPSKTKLVWKWWSVIWKWRRRSWNPGYASDILGIWTIQMAFLFCIFTYWFTHDCQKIIIIKIREIFVEHVFGVFE